jgi:hypothetical protein
MLFYPGPCHWQTNILVYFALPSVTKKQNFYDIDLVKKVFKSLLVRLKKVAIRRRERMVCSPAKLELKSTIKFDQFITQVSCKIC